MYKKKQQSFSAGIATAKIANLLEIELIGQKDALCYDFCPISNPQQDLISFSKSKNIKKLENALEGTKLAAIFISKNSDLPEDPKQNYFLVEDPQKALIQVLDLFYEKVTSSGKANPTAVISKSAQIGNNVEIGANVCIGDNVYIGDDTIILANSTIYYNSSIGSNCLIHSNVTIREETKIGNKVKIANGCVIGAEGFGYLPDQEAGILCVPQIGNVVIGDHVEIGANTCIDRAAMGSTVIGNATKIDNQVQIGHNVEIGDFSIICGQVGIGGSAKIGKQVTLGGAVKVQGHIEITNNTRVAGNSAVRQSVKQAGDYAGDPLLPIATWRRQFLTSQKKED